MIKNKELLLKIISNDIAHIQHNSSVLDQWPISSVESNYYLSAFLVPTISNLSKALPNDRDVLFENNIFPGKCAHLFFFLLNPKIKTMIPKGSTLETVINGLLEKIIVFRDFTETGFEDSLPSIFNNIPIANKINSRRLVFLLDNLNELMNPIYRTFGVQVFLNKNQVFRLYYNSGVKKILIVSPKGDFKMDFFEHISVPEDLAKSQVYFVEGNKILPATEDIIEKMIEDKIKELSNTQEFDKKYVIKRALSAMGIEHLSNNPFFESPFPKEIQDFYIKTCKLDERILSENIYAILGDKK